MNKIFQKLRDFFTKEYSEDTFSNSGNANDTSCGRRSVAYRRHFEGYTSHTETDEKGKKRTFRIYTGTWYTPNLTKPQRVGRKFAYSFFWIFCFADLMFCSMQDIKVNSMWYSALTQAITAGCMLWAFLGLFNYLIAPERRTVGEWKASTGSLKKSVPVTAVAFFLNFLINFLYLFYATNDDLGKQLLCVLLYIIGLGLLFYWNRLETNVTYIETPSEEKNT